MTSSSSLGVEVLPLHSKRPPQTQETQPPVPDAAPTLAQRAQAAGGANPHALMQALAEQQVPPITQATQAEPPGITGQGSASKTENPTAITQDQQEAVNPAHERLLQRLQEISQKNIQYIVTEREKYAAKALAEFKDKVTEEELAQIQTEARKEATRLTLLARIASKYEFESYQYDITKLINGELKGDDALKRDLSSALTESLTVRERLIQELTSSTDKGWEYDQALLSTSTRAREHLQDSSSMQKEERELYGKLSQKEIPFDHSNSLLHLPNITRTPGATFSIDLDALTISPGDSDTPVGQANTSKQKQQLVERVLHWLIGLKEINEERYKEEGGAMRVSQLEEMWQQLE